jgi:hypothetical protein
MADAFIRFVCVFEFNTLLFRWGLKKVLTAVIYTVYFPEERGKSFLQEGDFPLKSYSTQRGGFAYEIRD